VRPRHPGAAGNRRTDSHTEQLAARDRDQLLAVRVVAGHATGVEDCSELLRMLGLTRAAGLPMIDPPPARH